MGKFITFEIVAIVALISFTPMDWTALSVAIAALITAIFTGVVNIITALRSERKVDKIDEKTDIVKDKVDKVSDKADEIHTLTNSNLQKVTNALDAANAEIINLKKMVSDLISAKSIK